jgi:hypothetical protein
MLNGRPGGDREDLVGQPEAGAGDVYFHADGEGAGVIVAAGQVLAVVAGHEVRIRGRAGGDRRVLPAAATAAGLAELPELVSDTEPEGGFAIGRADDALRGGGAQGDATEDEQSAPRAEVVDGEIMRGDGTDQGDAAGVDGGEFVKRSVGVEAGRFR